MATFAVKLLEVIIDGHSYKLPPLEYKIKQPRYAGFVLKLESNDDFEAFVAGLRAGLEFREREMNYEREHNAKILDRMDQR